jgi:hypothetical protein
MAYFATSPCFACKQQFTFNPDRVPAFQGEPVCESCMAKVNAKRKDMGLPPHPILPGAYQIATEESDVEAGYFGGDNESFMFTPEYYDEGPGHFQEDEEWPEGEEYIDTAYVDDEEPMTPYEDNIEQDD